MRRSTPQPPGWRRLAPLLAGLALLLARERPALAVLIGDGDLRAPGVAAAAEAGIRLAFFGNRRGSADGALDLGAEPATALDRLTGVAREIG